MWYYFGKYFRIILIIGDIIKLKIEIEFLLNLYIKELNFKSVMKRWKDVICFDKGELFYFFFFYVIEVISNVVSEINWYLDILGGVLREVLVEYNGVKIEEIVVGNGLDDLIEFIVKVFVK